MMPSTERQDAISVQEVGTRPCLATMAPLDLEPTRQGGRRRPRRQASHVPRCCELGSVESRSGGENGAFPKESGPHLMRSRRLPKLPGLLPDGAI